MLKKIWALTIALIMVTAVTGCSKTIGQATQVAPAEATKQERQLEEVVMDLSIIASTDWVGREDEGKAILAETLEADKGLIDATAKAATSATAGSPEEAQYRALLWAVAQAQRATSTRGERVTKDVSEGIDKAFDVLDQGKEALDQVLNGTSKGGGGN